MANLTPCFDEGGITIYAGDCRKILPQLEQVDHVITDPPYAARAMKNARANRNITQRRDGEVYDFGYQALTPRMRNYTIRQAARLARRWVLIWSDIESDERWRSGMAKGGLRYVRTGIWVREHGAPQFSGDRPAQGVEACIIGHNAGGRMSWNGGGRAATWTGPIVNASAAKRGHTSPKPLWLMKALIRDFTNPGDVILDMFAGRLTTLIACAELGRRGIGIEVEPRFIDAGLGDLRQALAQAPLPISRVEVAGKSRLPWDAEVAK